MSVIRRIFVADLSHHVGEPVLIRGWVHRFRVLAKTTFLILKDCTGEAQCVAATEALRDLGPKLDDAVEIRGAVRAEKRAKTGLEIVRPTFYLLILRRTSRPSAPRSEWNIARWP